MNKILKLIGKEVLLLGAFFAILFVFKKAMNSSNDRIVKMNQVSQEKNDKIEADAQATIEGKRNDFTEGIIFKLYDHYHNNTIANLGTKPQFVASLQKEPKLQKFYQEYIVSQPIEAYRFETYPDFRAAIQTEFSSQRFNEYLESEGEIKSLIRQKSKKLTAIYETDDQAEIDRRTFVLGLILGSLILLRYLITFIPWIWKKATGRG